MPVQPELSEAAQSSLSSLPGPIMVLGAGGFIGANLALCLNRWRRDIYAVVQTLPASRLGATFPTARIVQVDIRQTEQTCRMLDDIAPQVVFDCVTYGGYSYQDNIQCIVETNFSAKVQMIEGMARRMPRAYIHSGSSSEYGLNCRAPAESAPLLPNSHYAVSKVAFAHYLAYMGKIREFPCVNLRLYSVYGLHEEPTRLMPTLVAHAMRGRYPPFVHRNISRDYVFVDDVCEAYILSACRMAPSLYGENINIGTGSGTTMAELAELTASLFNIDEMPRFGAMANRKWDLSDWFADPRKAKEVLGWQARMPLAGGLIRMADWMRAGG